MFHVIVTMKDVCDSTTLNFISRMVFGKEICVFLSIRNLIFKSYLYDLQVTTRYSGTCGLLRLHDTYV